MYTPTKIERFNQHVISKYQIYNSVFITLPFNAIDNTGALLPLFTEVCENGFKNEYSPVQIIEQFSSKYLDHPSEKELLELMFRFIQYIERQIVLFDAIEDAAFPVVNNMEGQGSIRDIKEELQNKNKLDELRGFLESFNIRTVLTAHPTQFYPGSVLGIITDLTDAVRKNDLMQIKELLSQLGKTPFIKKEKPTPYDEAVSLIWYLENVFYHTAGAISQYIHKSIFGNTGTYSPVINFGFWPGGDRDGNPFVTTEITLKVAERLRTSILKSYYTEVRKLRRKLTFYKVDDLVAEIEHKLYRSVFYSSGEIYITLEELKSMLNTIRQIIINEHQSLYIDALDALICKVNLFGFYFASLDIRQNSKVHDNVFKEIIAFEETNESSIFPKNYLSLNETEKMKVLEKIKGHLSPDTLSDGIARSTLESIYAMKTIQQKNGECGANRYIISNNESALHVLETFALFKLCNWQNPTVDIVPLFEVIDDLQNAHTIMEQLYTNPYYAAHLKSRDSKQIVMLGFSDGTKDGGYLMANWSIFKAKENITGISRKYGIKVVFFDGRGGPPARGGGKTHNFYASLGASIENQEIQMTVQGQTISSNFGTLDSCRFNLENLLSAGIANAVLNKNKHLLSEKDKTILDTLSQKSFEAYTNFKNHPKFIPYLEKISTLKYFSKANIGSRPSKRSKSENLDFNDLRAIPFVSSWSQMKQNVPGFFGVGTALQHYVDTGKWEDVRELYKNSLFFKTLLENSMMSLTKCFFPLTAYMKNDPEFGEFWQIIYNEFLLTKKLLLQITNYSELMENYPESRASIQMREHIVIPLLTIQQFALIKIKILQQEKEPNQELIAIYEKIVIRSLFGNTNASRNSA